MSEANLEARMRVIEDTLARMETKLDSALGNICDHEARLRKLEGRGGKLWEIAVAAVVSGAVGTIIGYFGKR
jgi:hypothetical protein